jgi:hypothetical protein
MWHSRELLNNDYRATFYTRVSIIATITEEAATLKLLVGLKRAL